MPELPFLTVLAENLERQVRDRVIEDVVVRGASVLKTVDPPIGAVRGARITGVRRRGKYLLLELDPGLVLTMHLMRNGRLRLVPRTAGGQRPARRAGRDLALVLALDDARDLCLIEMGPKKRAAVWLCRSGEEQAGPPAGLGMEPLSDAFTPDALAGMVREAHMRLKLFLTTQRFVVGIGNAYADEILWAARLSPQVIADKLEAEAIARLHAAITATLSRAIAAHRDELDGALPMKEPLSLLAVHRHGKEPCPRCGTPIAVIYYEDRETYYCPTCQTAGRVYADRRRSRLLK
ncbi:MAG TPA: DNA-formamidopyrimidine glycosylase family protein [bacterium]|nr:DNA-formamidopyrimidine glycosylase family protein [bacterium]